MQMILQEIQCIEKPNQTIDNLNHETNQVLQKKRKIKFEDENDFSKLSEFKAYPIAMKSTFSYQLYKSNKDLEMHDLFQRPVLSIQLNVTDITRGILLNWLLEISEAYGITTSTFFVAVNLLDCVLRLINIDKEELQLWGCVCLLFATKLYQKKVLTVNQLIFISHYNFMREDILKCEQTLISLYFNHDLNLTTRHSFGSFWLEESGLFDFLNDEEKSFYYFLLELSLFDGKLSQVRMSLVASACLHLTIQIMRPNHENLSCLCDEDESSGRSIMLWDDYFEQHTQFNEEELIPCIRRLHKLHWNCDSIEYFANVMLKYSVCKYYEVSMTIMGIPSHLLQFKRHTQQNRVDSNLTPVPFHLLESLQYNDSSNIMTDIIDTSTNQSGIQFTASSVQTSQLFHNSSAFNLHVPLRLKF